MSEKQEMFNPFDPTGVFKQMRDANLDSWSRMMVQVVNTEGYARATGALLDAWLANSAPLRKATETAMTQVLANAQMPTRADVVSLAERLTNIEMRLDDLAALWEEAPHAARKAAGPKTKANPAENEP